jgi:7-carboxy-7-deazaguanine synthase
MGDNMTNTQAPEKAAAGVRGSLDVHSVFYTIQGEGPLVGTPAVFVRLAGCNLQCPGCDTEYTSGRVTMPFHEILAWVRSVYVPYAHADFVTPLIVISGGEPFRQDIAPFIAFLVQLGYRVQIETNGTLGPSADDMPVWEAWTCTESVYVVCSPKAGKVNKNLAFLVGAYKYVMSSDLVDPEDGLPILALRHTASPRVARPGNHLLIYLQPMDEGEPIKNEANLRACIASCMRFGYRLCLQTHKIIGME